MIRSNAATAASPAAKERIHQQLLSNCIPVTTKSPAVVLMLRNNRETFITCGLTPVSVGMG